MRRAGGDDNEDYFRWIRWPTDSGLDCHAPFGKRARGMACAYERVNAKEAFK
jgi:hypothetical protein